MRTEEFAKEIEQRIRARGAALDTLAIADALDLMMTFYRQVDVTGIVPPPDDALKFSWGVIDRGQGEHFEVNLVRVLTTRRDAAPPLVRELELTYRFAPTAELRQIPRHELWGYSRAEMPIFATQVRDSEAFGIAQRETTLSVSVIFVDAAG